MSEHDCAARLVFLRGLSCRDFACSEFFPLTPDVSALVQGGFVPSAMTTSVRGTLRAPSGVRVCASEYCLASFSGLRDAARHASPTVGVSPLIFDAEMSPHPSRRSVSFASRNDPSETASRVTSSDAHGVIFRSTPKALNTSDDSGFPTR